MEKHEEELSVEDSKLLEQLPGKEPSRGEIIGGIIVAVIILGILKWLFL